MVVTRFNQGAGNDGRVIEQRPHRLVDHRRRKKAVRPPGRSPPGRVRSFLHRGGESDRCRFGARTESSPLGTPAASTASAMRASSVATITSSTLRARRTRSSTWRIIGRPAMSAGVFPGGGATRISPE